MKIDEKRAEKIKKSKKMVEKKNACEITLTKFCKIPPKYADFHRNIVEIVEKRVEKNKKVEKVEVFPIAYIYLNLNYMVNYMVYDMLNYMANRIINQIIS